MTNRCPVCGKRAPRQYVGGECSHECFHKSFWGKYVDLAKNGDIEYAHHFVITSIAVRIDGEHYIIDDEQRKGLRGFGGRTFYIKFLNGTLEGQVYKTTNLWYQGDIPEEYKDILSDNAMFVSRQNLDSNNTLIHELRGGCIGIENDDELVIGGEIMFKCGNCSYVSTVEEWHGFTEPYFDFMLIKLTDDDKNDGIFVCPNCKYEIPGDKIKEVK